MPKFRELKTKDIFNDQLHRWLVWLDDHSSLDLVKEVLTMDTVIQKAQNKIDIIREDPELLHSYEMYELQLMDERSRLEGALREGMREGMREGEMKKTVEIAKNLKRLGDTYERIAESTGLSIEAIKGL
jgi:predicted transposase/invertase (TIGR01784 family)